MEQDKRLTWAILIILIIFAIGFFIFAFLTRIQLAKQQYEIKAIEVQINSIEKAFHNGQNNTDNIEANDEAEALPEKEDIKAVLAECKKPFNNYYKDIDEQTIKDISDDNGEYMDYVDEGYKLKTVCSSNEKNLYLFDFDKGYFDAITKVSQGDLENSAKNLVIAVSSLNDYSKIDYYKVKVESYRFEGTGGIACNIDNYSAANDSVQYICVNSSDDGTEKLWYSLNLKTEDNNLVKESFDGLDKDTEQAYFNDLLILFSE